MTRNILKRPPVHDLSFFVFADVWTFERNPRQNAKSHQIVGDSRNDIKTASIRPKFAKYCLDNTTMWPDIPNRQYIFDAMGTVLPVSITSERFEEKTNASFRRKNRVVCFVCSTIKPEVQSVSCSGAPTHWTSTFNFATLVAEIQFLRRFLSAFIYLLSVGHDKFNISIALLICYG